MQIPLRFAQGLGVAFMDDPGAYTKPWTVHFQARLTGLPGDELMEYICQENNQYGIAQGFKPAAN